MINARLQEQAESLDFVIKHHEGNQNIKEGIDEDLLEKLSMFPISTEDRMKNLEDSVKEEASLISRFVCHKHSLN